MDRLFIGINIPDYVKAAVERLREEEGRPRGVSWLPPEKLHITLAFLGEVDADRQTEIMRRLPEAKVRPFFLALEGLGIFPKKGRPQVLWAGLEAVDPLLFQLHGKIERIVLDLGFKPERRRFDPHVTIARCGVQARQVVTTIMKKHADFGSAPFQVNDIILYASQLGEEGATYTELTRVPFDMEKDITGRGR